MKRAHDSWVVLGVLSGFMLVQPSQRVRAQSPGSARTWLLAADNMQKSETSAQSPYEVLDPAKYQCFVKNWDDKKNPVLYACIRSPAEWDKIFHPAPVMGSRKPFAPEPKVFETQDLLVVARVMPALDNDKAGASVFRVQRVGVSGQDLELHYKYDSPKVEGKTYQVKLRVRQWDSGYGG